MTSKRNMWLSIISSATIVLLTSCDTLTVYRHPGRGYGPPAHAQAHGYRRQVVHGYELTYDSATGLYVVVGMADCYYSEGCFYRLRGGLWEASPRARTWSPVGADKLPPGLRAKAHVKAKSPTVLKVEGNTLAKLSGPGNGNGKGKGNR